VVSTRLSIRVLHSLVRSRCPGDVHAYFTEIGIGAKIILPSSRSSSRYFYTQLHPQFDLSAAVIQLPTFMLLLAFYPHSRILALRWHLFCIAICWNFLSRSRLCHYSVGGAWSHLGFYESFQYPMRVISPVTWVKSDGVNMIEWASEIG
jgi:hypothetical protein